MVQKICSFSFLILFVLISGCTIRKPLVSNLPLEQKPTSSTEDPYLFLEERESAEAVAWAKERSDKSIAQLTSNARFAGIKADVKKIRSATDRLASPSLMGDYVYNFWTDAKHPKGIWRRTLAKDYADNKASWETLIDVKALADSDKQNWVWKGTSCLEPEYRYCLVHLSDGGEDAVIVREYDTKKKEFRADGFTLPEAKHTLAWWSEDVILLATDFGPGSLTKSGYPRIVKKWKRGTKFTDAELLLEGETEDVAVGVAASIRKSGTRGVVLRAPTFFENIYWSYSEKGGLTKLPLPLDAEGMGSTDDDMLVRFRTEWKLGATTIAAGSLVSFPVDYENDAKWEKGLRLIYLPDSRSSLDGVVTTKNHVFVSAMTEVKSVLLIAEKKDGEWKTTPAELPKDGTIEVLTTDDNRDELYVQYQSFLSPTTIYRGEKKADTEAFTWTDVAKLPDRFDPAGMTSEQRYATSKDGTKVPYFVMRKKEIQMDGSNPTLLYGYGGFEVSLLPGYKSEVGKTWVENGGVYVIANIRGGGEFGATWHKAAILEHRQRAYDDFIAVAEDLIANKYTSPRRLGIRGGSNGGLLVGAVTMQRPELFNAVICAVPLLDMVRYQALPPGDSWTAEYGSATDPIVGPVIRSYSPYQNISKDKKYPNIYFWSSQKDDRVHPGHARKMVARMEEYGHKVMYYESTAGGHGGAGDIDQSIADEAMAIAYLYQQLVD